MAKGIADVPSTGATGASTRRPHYVALIAPPSIGRHERCPGDVDIADHEPDDLAGAHAAAAAECEDAGFQRSLPLPAGT
jgi:hypothetical protein